MKYSRRAFLAKTSQGCAGIYAAMHFAGIETFARSAAAVRPNIVLILADDMGYSDLSCMGSEIPTPNIDSIAEQGVLFKNFYNCAKCTPTRGSLLTGLHPHSSGTDGNGGGLSDANPAVTIAEVLKTAGYNTAMSGKWHLKADPLSRGFDRGFVFMGGALSNYRTPGDVYLEGQKFQRPDNFHFTDGVTDYSVDYIKSQPSDNAFFLYVAYTAPHWSFAGLIGEARPEDAVPFMDTYNVGYDVIRQKRYEKMIAKGLIKPEWKMAPNDADSWDSLDAGEKKTTAEEMANHAGLIAQMDRGVGKILKALEDKGIAENTLVLFLSDNGASPEGQGFGAGWANACCSPFKKYKLHLHEGGICTPLCARWPKIISAPMQTDHAGHLVDIMATCAEISGATYPSSFKGKSIPPCQGKSLTSAFQRFADPGHDHICWEYEGKMAVQQGKWKAIGKGTSWKELYDLEADRCETNNLAGSNSQKLNELKALYSKWWNNEWIIYEQATANRPSLPLKGANSLQRLSSSVYKAFSNRITLPDDIVRATRWIDIFDSRGKYCHTIAHKGRRCIHSGKQINASHGFWIIKCR